MSPLSAKAIQHHLTPDIVRHDIVCLKTVGSTNDWMRAAAAEGAPERLIVLSEEQTAGHGQVGRAWVAPYGRSLLMSTLFRPHLSPNLLFALTMIGSCAAAAAVIELTGLNVQIKWPNDLVCQGQKLGGVLTVASVTENAVNDAVLGLGVNVNLSRRALADIPGATSIQALIGHPISRNRLAATVIRGIDERYRLIQNDQIDAVVAEWRERSATIGTWVNLIGHDGIEGPLLAKGVTSYGTLVLMRQDGSTFEAVAGDVSARPAPVPTPPPFEAIQRPSGQE